MKYLKSFFLRGALFAGLGPIIVGLIYLILSFNIKDFSLSGGEIFVAIISTYLLAFIQAGASVFNQIEGWSIPKSIFFHLSSIYIAYVLCYLINSWIPFDWKVILIFTGVFVLTYFIIWVSVYISVKITSKKLNKKMGA